METNNGYHKSPESGSFSSSGGPSRAGPPFLNSRSSSYSNPPVPSSQASFSSAESVFTRPDDGLGQSGSLSQLDDLNQLNHLNHLNQLSQLSQQSWLPVTTHGVDPSQLIQDHSFQYQQYPAHSSEVAPDFIFPDELRVDFASQSESISSLTHTSTEPHTPVTEFSFIGTAEPASGLPDAKWAAESVPSPGSAPSPGFVASPGLFQSQNLLPLPESRKRGSDDLNSFDRISKLTASLACGTDAGLGPTPGRTQTVAESTTRDHAKPKSRKTTRKKSPQQSSAALAQNTGSSDGSGVNVGTQKAPQLRTASRKPKANRKDSTGSLPKEEKDNEEENLLTSEERRARYSHNLVEKQYRNRLNNQFGGLAAVLPPAASGASRKGSDESDQRRFSKAEVLELARDYILELEAKIERYESERVELTANMGVMRNAVANGGFQESSHLGPRGFPPSAPN